MIVAFPPHIMALALEAADVEIDDGESPIKSGPPPAGAGVHAQITYPVP